MVDPSVVQRQLKDIGCNFSFFGRPELRELPSILQPGEVIAQCVNGFYENGFATLCVTNERLLVIDRKTFFMTIEDIHFDMVAEIDYSRRLFASTARVFTPNKSLKFTTLDQPRLARSVDYLQQRVMESRQRQGSDMRGSVSVTAPILPAKEKIVAVQPAPVTEVVAQEATREPDVLAQVALRSLDRFSSRRSTRLPLFRRRRYPSFYPSS